MANAAGHRESTERGAVVAALRGDEPRAARDRTGELEGALDGLGAAGTEGAEIEIARRDLRQALRQCGRETLRRNEQEMRRLRLQHFLDRSAHVRVIVPEGHRSVPGEEVEHFVALVVPERQILGTDEIAPEAEQVERFDEGRIEMIGVQVARLRRRERQGLPDLLADAHGILARRQHQYHRCSAP